MCVLMDMELNGFPFTSTKSPLPNPVLVTSGEMSAIELPSRFSPTTLVNLPSDVMFETVLSPRDSPTRLVNLPNDVMSVIELFPTRSPIRLVNPPNDVMFEMVLPERSNAIRLVNPPNDVVSVIELPSRASSVKLVNPPNDVMVEMLLSARNSHVRLVNPPNDVMSVIELPSRNSSVRLINLRNDERSVMELLLIRRSSNTSPPRFSTVRLVACSSPVKSLMLAFGATRRGNPDISDTVIVAPGVLPKADSIAARRFASGMFTVCAVAVNGIKRHINRKKVNRKGRFVIDLSPL